MSKTYVYELACIRGLAMLGVLGIHTAAYSLNGPEVNIHVFGLLDILTRFCVPIFFFVSAFGLFLGFDLTKPLDYESFLRRRATTVLLPYLAWTAVYLVYTYLTTGNHVVVSPPYIAKSLLFGLGSYHLYFMILLLWFYLLMPFWKVVVRKIIERPLLHLSFLFFAQIAFNYVSSQYLSIMTGIRLLDMLLEYRLNYWVIHYAFIFLLGAVCGVRFYDFINWLNRWRKGVTIAFTLSLSSMITTYYFLVYHQNVTAVDTLAVLNQLQPLGMVYTLTATLFAFLVFQLTRSASLLSAFQFLGAHSYVIYLVHPLAMYTLVDAMKRYDVPFHTTSTLLFYVLSLMLSLAASVLLTGLQSVSRPFGIFTGSFSTRTPRPVSPPNQSNTHPSA